MSHDSDPLRTKLPAGSCAITDPLLSELKELKSGEALCLTDASGRIFVVMNWDDIRPHLKPYN